MPEIFFNTLKVRNDRKKLVLIVFSALKTYDIINKYIVYIVKCRM